MYKLIVLLLLLINSIDNSESFHNYNIKHSLCNYPIKYNILHYENKNIEPENNEIVITTNSPTNKQDTINNINNNSNNNIFNYFLLNFVAILWGSQHVIIKSAVLSFPSTSLVNFWRFFISSLLFSPSLIQTIKDKNAITLKAGIELGFYTFLGFAFQAIGLETTTATRSAFLLYLNVKLVPILAVILYQRRYPITTWVSALSALLGTLLLSTDGSPPNVGDIWCILAACASALFILRLEKFSNETKPAELNSVSFMTVLILSSLWVIIDELTNHTHYNMNISKIIDPFISNIIPIVYLGGISTGLCNYLQTIGQKTIPADKAAIVYSMDPVYGAIFSNWILHEQIGTQGYIGGLFILIGVWISVQSNKNNK